MWLVCFIAAGDTQFFCPVNKNRSGEREGERERAGMYLTQWRFDAGARCFPSHTRGNCLLLFTDTARPAAGSRIYQPLLRRWIFCYMSSPFTLWAFWAERLPPPSVSTATVLSCGIYIQFVSLMYKNWIWCRRSWSHVDFSLSLCHNRAYAASGQQSLRNAGWQPPPCQHHAGGCMTSPLCFCGARPALSVMNIRRISVFLLLLRLVITKKILYVIVLNMILEIATIVTL